MEDVVSFVAPLYKAFKDIKVCLASTINRETIGQFREHNCFK